MLQANPNCRKCELWKGNHSVCLRARGSDTPKVLFVGEAPGEREDETGKPFMGPAGQLLQQAINVYKIPDYRITNVVRCRPPDNRKPAAKEVLACSSYMVAEVETVKPSIIVTLGAVPLLALAGKSKVTEWAGQMAGEYRGIPVFSMLHPAYILRDPRKLPKFEQGFRELTYRLRPTTRPKHPKTCELTPVRLSDLLTHWKSYNRIVSWDYETTSASPWNGNRVRSVGFSDGSEGWWINLEKHGERARRVICDFLRSDIVKTAHNLYFEYLWSMVYFGIEPRMAKYDTMSSHYLVNENKPHSLDQVADEYLGVPNWDIHGEMLQKGWTFATVPLEKAGPYNALDALYTAQVREPIFKKLMSRIWLYDNILLPLTKTCARMSRRGIMIDSEWAGQVVTKYRQDMKRVEKDFAASPAVQVATKDQGAAFNINSARQIGNLFYDRLKLPVPGLTKKGILLVQAGQKELAYKTYRSVAEKMVETLKDKHPLVAKYTEWKKKKTVITNYLEKFPKFCDMFGMIHQEYKTSFVVTGRLSCAEPPAHSFPIDPLVRGMVVSRHKGGKILSADYKQLEVRLAVNEAGEEDLIAAIKAGLDVHDETAKKMFGKDFTKEQRKKAKTFNFGVLYGMTEYKIASDWHIPKEEGKKYLDQYWKSRPLLARWMRKIHAHLEEHGFVESRFGRRRNLNLAGMTEKERGHALRQAGNFPIQSTGADICNLAAIAVDRELRCRKMKSCLIHSIHDSLIIDVHPKEEKVVSELVVNIMQNKIPGSLKWLRVPLEVDVEISPRWGKAEKVA